MGRLEQWIWMHSASVLVEFSHGMSSSNLAHFVVPYSLETIRLEMAPAGLNVVR